MNKPRIYLASQSPRRSELLHQLGIDFSVLVADVPEVVASGEQAEEFVQRLALDKARVGWQLSDQTCPVMGADTVVVVDGMILGKPADAADARDMLMELSGRSHVVMTAVALVQGDKEALRLNCSTVTFRKFSEQECHDYVATGEPLDKAGAYAVQGHAAIFIKELHGSYSGVMGLPLYETAQLLEEFNIPLF